MPEENVKVAVRVRPFNSREKTRNASVIIKMSGQSTEIKDPEDMSKDGRMFSFDYSYWSHDGFRERDDGYLEPESPQYADQLRVFNDLGLGVLENAWKGYNCSLFAYGQTGSGKSYSIVGYGSNKGIIPMFCDELFKGIEEKRSEAKENEEYQVHVSILEIYNEQVRDLLNAKSMGQKGGLKVRQHPTKGFYVESLVTAPVNSYKEIDNKINEGTRNRTVAATNMNATSSRAHTIVGITFVQKAPNESGQSMTKTSVVNLVDLAGSERADSTGATGDRLKEGSAINQSLSTLGNVIKALADQSSGKKKVMVPYRDSVLTKLLQNALGGNSKTVMVAALSPADINYEETLSTLRFADRAKAIKTSATINESPTDKLIRELREENARLMELLKTGGVPMQMEGGAGGGSSDASDEVFRMQEELRKNQEEMENMKKTWEERMKESQVANKAMLEEERKKQDDRKVIPHFWNLNEDPSLTAMVIHFCNSGTLKIGNKKASPPPDIQLNGLSIQQQHAEVSNKGGEVKLKAFDNAKIMVNGQKITKEVILRHNDRVLFGPNHLYVFHHPQDEAKQFKSGTKVETPTYESAQEEIAERAGLMSTEGKSKDDLILQDEVVQMLPMVSEANAISEELNKKVKFELALISPQARGQRDGKTEVMVKMENLENGNYWMWDRNKFINRKFIMSEMYQNYLEDEEWDLPQDKDPFWEPVDTELLIGTVHLHLMSLAHKLDIEENLTITNYKGDVQGHLDVKIIPVDAKGNDLGEDDFIDTPDELVGKELYFNFMINNARGLPQNIQKSFCKYKFYLDDKPDKTKEIDGTMNPDFKYSKNFKFKTVTAQMVEYLQNDAVVIEVWGKQKDYGSKSKGGTTTAAVGATNTKQLMAKDQASTPKPAEMEKKKDKEKEIKPQSNQEKNGAVPVAAAASQQQQQQNKQMVNDLNTYKQRTTDAESRLGNIQNLLDQKLNSGNQTVDIAELQALLKGGNYSSSSNGAAKSGGESSKACVVQ